MKVLSLLTITSLLLSTGCAHVAEIVDNQEIETSHLGPEGGEDARVITLGGHRRLVRSTYKEGSWVVCAETQADAIGSRSANANLSIAERVQLGDAIQEALTITNNRTELSDTVRQLAWNLCNNRANGYITDEKVATAMTSLIDGSMNVLQLRAAADLAAVDKLRTALAAANAKLKAFMECTVKAEGDRAKIAACITS